MTVQVYGTGSITGINIPALGQCRLARTSNVLMTLQPYQGNLITIQGITYQLPASGITLSSSAALANTTYYVYVLQTAGVLSLEYSTTGHAPDTTTANNIGVEIKSGDPSRTLVGMTRTEGAGAWVDSLTRRYTLSWFNRRNLSLNIPLGSNVQTASTTYTEVEATWRLGGLAWAGDEITYALSGAANCSAASTVYTQIAYITGSASVQPFDSFCAATIPTGTYVSPIGINGRQAPTTDGHFIYGVYGQTGSGNAQWIGAGSSGFRSVLSGSVQG